MVMRDVRDVRYIWFFLWDATDTKQQNKLCVWEDNNFLYRHNRLMRSAVQLQLKNVYIQMISCCSGSPLKKVCVSSFTKNANTTSFIHTQWFRIFFILLLFFFFSLCCCLLLLLFNSSSLRCRFFFAFYYDYYYYYDFFFICFVFEWLRECVSVCARAFCVFFVSNRHTQRSDAFHV